jgi:hypothetical protein
MTLWNQRKALLSDILRHLAISAQLFLLEVPQLRSLHRILS